MLTGLNHITLQVADLERSIEFYTHILGMKCRAHWRDGAYLELGELWYCLIRGRARPSDDYTHIAFSADAGTLALWHHRVEAHGIVQWKENESQGASLYILDPDGHRLEIHWGDLESRLASLTPEEYPGLVMGEPAMTAGEEA